MELPQEGNEKRGQLIEVSDLGVTLRHDSRGEHYEKFYPWSVVGGIRPRPELTPPEG